MRTNRKCASARPCASAQASPASSSRQRLFMWIVSGNRALLGKPADLPGQPQQQAHFHLGWARSAKEVPQTVHQGRPFLAEEEVDLLKGDAQLLESPLLIGEGSSGFRR